MEEALVRGADRESHRRHRRWNPILIVRALLRRPFVYWVPFCPFYDRIYALIQFIFTHWRWPRRYLFNDRLIRMKMQGELLDPHRQALSDKEFVKHYAEALLGPEYLPATYAVLKTKQEVYDYQFPKECVVKPSHSTGQYLFVRDGVVDRKLVASWLDYSLYRRTREQNYAFLKPKIVVEEFVFGPEYIPDDYKFYCVDGEPRAIMMTYDRSTDMTGRFYDTDWNPQDYMLLVPLGRKIPCPANLNDMLRVAAVLAQGLDFVRIDLYTDGKSVKVGEITSCTGSARDKFYPPEGEHQLSVLLFGEEK